MRADGDVTVQLLDLLDRVSARRWRLLPLWLGSFVAMPGVIAGDGDWDFFRRGTQALLGGRVFGSAGGLHLYATRPNTQIGPPALVAALPFRLMPRPWDIITARVAMCLAMLLVLWLVEQLALSVGVRSVVRQRTSFLGGLLMTPAWVAVAVTYAHLDDVMVVLLALLAMVLVAQEKPLWAAVPVGLAVASKPWALVVAALLLRRGWSFGMRPILVAAGAAVAPWIPFLVDGRTTAALWKFRIPVSLSSGLTVLGVDTGPMPSWVRPTQLIGGLVLGVLAARSGRWTGILAVGFATRVGLDPQAFSYYDFAPVVGALAWDMSRSKIGVPWTAALTAAGLLLSSTLGAGRDVAAIRLLTCAGLAVGVFLSPAPCTQADVGVSGRLWNRDRRQVVKESSVPTTS